MSISLGKLQQLLTVARCRNISRAAAELNVSQPALSRSIAALEDHYGFAIFNRSGHGVEPTSAGFQLLDQAASALQSLHVFESNMHLIATGRGGKLAMGMAPLLASQLLSRFTQAFFGADSQAQLRVMIRPGGELLEALKNDEIEMFFYPETHLAPTEEIDTSLVGYIRATCIVRGGHPVLQQGPLSIEKLSEFPWASAMDQSIGTTFPITASLICDNYHILREALIATDLVGICSREFVAEELGDGRLVELHVENLPMGPTGIYLAKLKGRMHSPLASAAIARIESYLSGA